VTDVPRVTVHVDQVSVEYRVRSAGGGRGPAALANAFRRTSRVSALTDVTLDLHAGEVVGLIGGNGAGKSTLVRAIAGLTPASSGTILAVSRPLLLSVGAALLPELTGRRNAYLGCLAQGMPPADARDAAQDAIEFAGIGDAIERPLSTYSSGMTARLKFAIATVQTREILLVDEALSVGDAAFSERARERMSILAGSSGTVVLVSHSVQSLSESCSRGVWLDSGRIVLDGPIKEVLDAYRQLPPPSLIPMGT